MVDYNIMRNALKLSEQLLTCWREFHFIGNVGRGGERDGGNTF